jgi:hypothetical protein
MHKCSICDMRSNHRGLDCPERVSRRRWGWF